VPDRAWLNPVRPSPAPAAPDTLRLFFALWPDDATRDALNRAGKWLHQHWGGRRMRADTLHITLAFLGSTPAEQLDALTACADAVQADAFELILDQAGYWRHNRIGWLGASQTPPQHVELVGALNAALRAAGFPSTRARMCRTSPCCAIFRRRRGASNASRCTGRSAISCWWPRARESDGAHYDVIRRWPLA
jgi:RNA 2',3'-cyclic 3'-phosphodiesterase